jgi:hypothetical protein
MDRESALKLLKLGDSYGSPMWNHMRSTSGKDIPSLEGVNLSLAHLSTAHSK